jgi:LemA protein
MVENHNLVSVEDKIYKNILNAKKKNKRTGRRKNPTAVEKLITAAISIVILVFAFGAAYYYNTFINLQYNIEENIAQIDTQLQKRKNLIINLGTTVVEYSKHEREIFTHLAELRALISGGNTEGVLNDIRNRLDNNDPMSAKPGVDLAKWESVLSNLMAVAEQYPDLKLSENFRTFMDAILEFEGTIAELRMTYNQSINDYSTTRDQFPGVIFATIFRCKDYPYFQVDEETRGFVSIGN